MADFFSKLKKGIDKGTAIVSTKSSTMIEVNKLKSEISTTQKVKKETLLELGTKVFTLYQEGTFDIGQVQDLITNIGEADIRVAELETQIAKIQDEEKTKLDEIKAEEPEVKEAVNEAIEEVGEINVQVVEVVEETSDEAKEVVEGIIDTEKDKI
ncbi:hypothetical protein [Petrocella sp. FN5]|uniref:hypothetical protein n=1 Tax=Petrocella sp. FN5 TaxID=3032002 RepID=UPI0023DABEF3|nr:hypothetical protein [Petrocella sp. FN5]MDF1617931.1 hypothetical protein [Petrocella sp. FN5]